jgi:hypothetical protein
VPGFSNAVALKLSDKLFQSAKQLGLKDDETKQIEHRLIDWDDVPGSLAPWTEVIADSAADAYCWEVEASNDQMSDRAKRRVKKEFIEVGWIEKIICLDDKDPGNEKIPPEPRGFKPYKVAMDGKSSGPFDWIKLCELASKGQLTSSTKVWRKPMTDWQKAEEIEELSLLLESDEPPLTDDDEPPLA